VVRGVQRSVAEWKLEQIMGLGVRYWIPPGVRIRLSKGCAEGHSPFAGCVRVSLTVIVLLLFLIGKG